MVYMDLDTIVSGSYIELHGVKEKKTKLEYIGWEHPNMEDKCRRKISTFICPKQL